MINFDKSDDMLTADQSVRYAGMIDSAGNIVAPKSRRTPRGGGGRSIIIHLQH